MPERAEIPSASNESVADKKLEELKNLPENSGCEVLYRSPDNCIILEQQDKEKILVQQGMEIFLHTRRGVSYILEGDLFVHRQLQGAYYDDGREFPRGLVDYVSIEYAVEHSPSEFYKILGFKNLADMDKRYPPEVRPSDSSVEKKMKELIRLPENEGVTVWGYEPPDGCPVLKREEKEKILAQQGMEFIRLHGVHYVYVLKGDVFRTKFSPDGRVTTEAERKEKYQQAEYMSIEYAVWNEPHEFYEILGFKNLTDLKRELESRDRVS